MGLAFYCGLYESDWFPVSKLLLVSTLNCVPLLCLLLEESFLIFYGRETVNVGNCSTDCLKQLKIYPCPKPHSNLLLEVVLEINKALKSTPDADIFGIVSGYTFISTVPTVFLISFGIVISDADLVFIVSYVWFKYLGFCTIWLSNWYVIIIRYLSTLYVLQGIAVVIPTFTVLIEAISQGSVSSLAYLKKTDLKVPNIQLFKNMFLAYGLVFNIV